MSKNRIKSATSTANLSREEVETLVSEIANLKNQERELTTQQDAELTACRTIYEFKLRQVAEPLKEKTAIVQAWAESNPDLFAKRKSMEFANGTIGFRTGTHKLKLLVRQTWERVLENLKARSWGPSFIRTKEEVDKEKLIRGALNRDEKGHCVIPETALQAIGVRLVQDEIFFIEPKLTEVEARESAPSKAA